MLKLMTSKQVRMAMQLAWMSALLGICIPACATSPLKMDECSTAALAYMPFKGVGFYSISELQTVVFIIIHSALLAAALVQCAY